MTRRLPLSAAALLLAATTVAGCQSSQGPAAPGGGATTTATGTSAPAAGSPTPTVAATSPAPVASSPASVPAPPAPVTSSPGTAASTAAGAASSIPARPSQPSGTWAAPAGTAELPRGGTAVFPRFRLMGWCGYPGAPGQGELGLGNLQTQMTKMLQQSQAYAGDREVLPVMELIATTVQPVPGPDGRFRTRTDPAIIDEWLRVARENKAILLLNIQPGTADFLPEVQYFEKWLAQPDVGVALDPEWAIEPGQKPGAVFGSTTGAELDGVAAYLQSLVEQHRLPEKVMVYHQLHMDVVKNEQGLKAHPGVALVKSVDGIGVPNDKTYTWNKVTASMPAHVHAGFKLFFAEDVQAGGPLMTPAQVLALAPTPDYVLYE